MEIKYDKNKIKKDLLKYAQSNRITAKRMLSIKAAKNFCDLELPSNGRAHFLEGKYAGRFSIDLEKKGNGKRLICQPLGNELQKMNNGLYKKETITALKILEISDYHKK
ncbi:MAG: hypothetical protein WC823_04205 [Parcubacteria group bacterium]|jgi:hypothetical protein